MHRVRFHLLMDPILIDPNHLFQDVFGGVWMYFSGLRNQLLCAMLFISDAFHGFTQHILQGLAATVLQWFLVPGGGCNDPSHMIQNDLLIPYK